MSGSLQAKYSSRCAIMPEGLRRRALLLAQAAFGGRQCEYGSLTDVDAGRHIGARVEMVTRKLTTDGERGIIVYGYKFRPLVN